MSPARSLRGRRWAPGGDGEGGGTPHRFGTGKSCVGRWCAGRDSNHRLSAWKLAPCMPVDGLRTDRTPRSAYARIVSLKTIWKGSGSRVCGNLLLGVRLPFQQIPNPVPLSTSHYQPGNRPPHFFLLVLWIGDNLFHDRILIPANRLFSRYESSVAGAIIILEENPRCRRPASIYQPLFFPLFPDPKWIYGWSQQNRCPF